MNSLRNRKWFRTAGRLGISAFLVFHIGATVVWVLPPCPVRQRCFDPVACYIMPLGLWQYWGMFAPDPVRDTMTLEADAVDARGLRTSFVFPKLADYSTWRGIPRFRHSKFAANLSVPELQLQREYTARHVVRRLGMPDEAFPVDVHLLYQVRLTPPPGGPPADPMTPAQPYVIGTYHFETPGEVRQ